MIDRFVCEVCGDTGDLFDSVELSGPEGDQTVCRPCARAAMPGVMARLERRYERTIVPKGKRRRRR